MPRTDQLDLFVWEGALDPVRPSTGAPSRKPRAKRAGREAAFAPVTEPLFPQDEAPRGASAPHDPSLPRNATPIATLTDTHVPLVAPPSPPTLTHQTGASVAPAVIPTPCPQTLPMGARWREVHTEQQVIGFVLLRSRRRSIGFMITDDGLRVTAPNWVTLGQVDEAVVEKARWILSKLRDWHVRQEKLALSHTRWQAGGELPYLGKRIVLALGAKDRQAFIEGDADSPRDGDKLWLALPEDADQSRVRDAAQAWLQGRAREWIGARLAHFLQATGLKIRRWRLSAAVSRWGSCTSDGNIMLNWRLIHFAPSIVDYVVAHELAHLREMNHSRDFWAEVGAILPEFEQARNALRAYNPAHLPD